MHSARMCESCAMLFTRLMRRDRGQYKLYHTRVDKHNRVHTRHPLVLSRIFSTRSRRWIALLACPPHTVADGHASPPSGADYASAPPFPRGSPPHPLKTPISPVADASHSSPSSPPHHRHLSPIPLAHRLTPPIKSDADGIVAPLPIGPWRGKLLLG